MAKANESSNKDKNVTINSEADTVYIPMVVNLEAFKENGFIAGVSLADVRHNWRIGNRYCDVVLVPGTEEEKREYLRTITDEFKKEDRDARCRVSNGKGHIIRCPESNLCSKCPYNTSLDKHSDRTQTFSELAQVNEAGEVTDFEPAAPTDYCAADTYSRILEKLIDHLLSLNGLKNIDRLVEVIKNRADDLTIIETAQEIGCGKSTVDSDLDKLYPIVKAFLEDLI
ncbi:hypothetical protein PMF13cell1_03541 [Blautia producta]|uniref:Uncharacterized protein n=1 Tax=Blautia producta TaxID=33035 RepID=A0A4V0Z7U1_9FIRM|nr:hypothetical protein [Blautia producta]QBE97978.1 hypothetical protein PMF13cell1_03541 [Blautia producta]